MDCDWRTADALRVMRPFLGLSIWDKTCFVLSPNQNVCPGMALLIVLAQWLMDECRLVIAMPLCIGRRERDGQGSRAGSA